MWSIDQILKKNEGKAEDYKEFQKRNFYKRFAFNDRGNTYVCIEDIRTEDEKTAFKAAGGIYTKNMGWHAPNPVRGFKTVPCRFSDVCEYDGAAWHLRAFSFESVVKAGVDKRTGKRARMSEFIGKVGEYAEFNAKLETCYETHFQNDNKIFGGLEKKWDYVLRNEGKNIVVFSSAWYDPEKVKEFFGRRTVKVRAKVMANNERFGRKETYIGYPTIVRADGKNLKEFACIAGLKSFDEVKDELRLRKLLAKKTA